MFRTLLCTLLLSVPLYSATAPHTEAQLRAAAVLVVDARCVEVSSLGRRENAMYKGVTWDSTMVVERVLKGKPPKMLIVRGTQTLEQGYEGDAPLQALPPGWSGRLYLRGDEKGRYAPVHWSGIQENAKTSKPQPFPQVR
jgi:hypothetical protein